MIRNNKVVKLFVCLACLIFFLMVVLPLINNEFVPSQVDRIKARNLDSGALIYSDSEEAVEGNYFLLKSR